MTETETYQWPLVRERAIVKFGGAPGKADLEQDVIAGYERFPRAVELMIERISSDPNVRSPWPVLRHEVLRMLEHNPEEVDGAGERDLRIRQAESLIRNAGAQFPSEEELLEELFERGVLRSFAGDDELRARMVAKWRELVPANEETAE